MFSAAFWAVPALSRVEPAITSGPASTSMAMSAAAPSGDPGAQLSPTTRAPARRASATAASTYAVRPLALTPTTASRGPSAAARVGRAHLAVVLRLAIAGGMRLHEVSGNAEGGRALRGVERGQPPAGPSPEIVKPAAGAQSLGDLLDRFFNPVERPMNGFDRSLVLDVHELEQLADGEPVEIVGPWVGGLTHLTSKTSAAAMPQTREAPCVAR